jgi:hypothetical protein
MTCRIAALLCLALCLATNAAAQLASQTALVGTVTDSADQVVPGVQVVAVNTGTKDTYETTTNAEGYYNIQFVRAGIVCCHERADIRELDSHQGGGRPYHRCTDPRVERRRQCV